MTLEGELETQGERGQSLYDRAQAVVNGVAVDGLAVELEGDALGRLGAIAVVDLLDWSDLGDRLALVNNDREKFRENIHLALVFWVNDLAVSLFVCRAPDFHNWATPPIDFTWPLEVLEVQVAASAAALLAGAATKQSPTSPSLNNGILPSPSPTPPPTPSSLQQTHQTVKKLRSPQNPGFSSALR